MTITVNGRTVTVHTEAELLAALASRRSRAQRLASAAITITVCVGAALLLLQLAVWLASR